MKFKLPKIRLTLNANTGKVSLTKVTPTAILNANIKEATKKAPPMPFVRNRTLRRILKLLMSK